MSRQTIQSRAAILAWSGVGVLIWATLPVILVICWGGR
jgi:hypothetical protein